ncbi:MAG: HAD family hydrolase [Anaerolineae bacterium]|nr:HAD family hydrolase [Anaerolineae bacterium]
MIKAITFDFWQTLYQGQKVDYAERLRQLKAKVERGQATTFSLEQFQDAVLVARDAWTRAWEEDHRTLSAAEWLEIMLRELGVTLAPDDLQQIQTDMEESVLQNLPILVPGIEVILQELSVRYRLGVISDTGITPGRMLRQIMTEDKIIDYFTHLTFSDELGSSKPHPNNFLSTLKVLDAQPEEAVHIGDLLRTDILGAQAVGMRGVQYIGLQEDDITEVTKNVTPNAVISDYTELFALLDQWNNLTGK